MPFVKMVAGLIVRGVTQSRVTVFGHVLSLLLRCNYHCGFVRFSSFLSRLDVLAYPDPSAIIPILVAAGRLRPLVHLSMTLEWCCVVGDMWSVATAIVPFPSGPPLPHSDVANILSVYEVL